MRHALPVMSAGGAEMPVIRLERSTLPAPMYAVIVSRYTAAHAHTVRALHTLALQSVEVQCMLKLQRQYLLL
jgi:hypothetical protein